MSVAALVPVLALGLAGSLHCAGMCGPLALSFALALAGPFAFGLATGPMLGLVALGAGRIPATWRARGARLAALGLLAYGGWTLVRGLAPVAPEASAKVLPKCCRDGDVSKIETE